jgi:rhodanese-related sulfurtransferase
VKQVDADSLSQIIASGQIVALFDLRSPGIIAIDGIPGAKAINLEDIQNDLLPDLPKDTPIYLICERGVVSELAGLYFETAGFTEVYNLAGGMIAWRKVEEEGGREGEGEKNPS